MTFPAPLAHGPITRISDGVYVVRGSFRMAPGMRIGRTMTVIDSGGELTVLNAVRLDAEGEAELDKLGKVKHLVKLSDTHSLDEPYYADRYKPEVWTLEGAKLGKLASTRQLGPESPIADGAVLEYPGATAWRECALLVTRGGGTLVTCDAIQNCVDGEGASFVGRIAAPMLGFKGGVIVPKMWRKYHKLAGSAVAPVFAQLVERSFANLVAGHGPAAVGGADEQARAAVRQAST